MQDSDRAGELYEKAHERFKRGREAIDEIWSNADLLQRVRAAGRIRELEANESMLLNAYAITCLEEATKADDRNERIIFDRQADNLFRSALQKYPDDAHTINKYADFLLKYAWLLPEYQIPRRRNVLEAKNLLRGAMDRARVAGQQTDAITQHTLARLYIYYERPPNFAEAESLLKKSAASSDPWQQAISWLELAKLYIRRAREQGDVSSSQSYFTLAGGATEHAELDLNRHTINHVVKVHQTRALLHLSEKQFTKAEAEWKSIQDLYEKTSFRKLAPLAQVITSVGDELFDERDWDGAEWCFSKASSIAGCGWYSHYRLGETRMQVDRHAEAFRDFVRSAELSSYARGFASVRNAAYKIEHALRNKGSSEVELAKYRQKRFEFSRKAHELDPLNWKNCADRAEDLRQSGDFREALPILWAARLRLFLTIRHDRHRTIRSWHERRRRDALSRLYWNTGRALDGMNETSEESKAKHKIRAGARLENSESGWRELARIEAGWGMFSHVIEAHEAWLRCIERMDPVRWKELDGAAVRNMLQLAYKAYEKEGKFAEAALADRYYAELYHALGGWSLPSHRIFAAAGDWLLSRRIAGLAFECLLNACRLSPLPAYRRKLAEAAKLKGSGLAEPLYARAIETEYAEPFRRQMEVVLHSLSSRSQPQTEVEQAVLAELLGDAGAIDRYANLARSIVSRDVVNPSEARLVADGLLLANKSEQARTMFRWLSEQLAMPEKYYLVATLCSVQKPLTQ